MLGLSIPFYDEEGAVEQVLHQTRYVLQEANIPFIIAAVNNGSSDKTSLIIDEFAEKNDCVIPIHFDVNQGYGGGILSGMRALAMQNVTVIGWGWGDGQVLPNVLPDLYQLCLDGHPLAKARRDRRKDGWIRKVITQSYAQTMRRLGVNTRDINGCPKLFRIADWSSLEATSEDWFLDAEVILKAEHKGWEIGEATVTMEPRYYNQSKVRFSTVVEFMQNIIQWKLRR